MSKSLSFSVAGISASISNLEKWAKENTLLVLLILAVLGFFAWNAMNTPQTENFEAEAKRIVLFYAPWCPHCKDVLPVWDQLKQRHTSDSLIVETVDCEADKKAAADNEIEGYPTIILFQGNRKLATYESGDRSVEAIEAFINSN